MGSRAGGLAFGGHFVPHSQGARDQAEHVLRGRHGSQSTPSSQNLGCGFPRPPASVLAFQVRKEEVEGVRPTVEGASRGNWDLVPPALNSFS